MIGILIALGFIVLTGIAITIIDDFLIGTICLLIALGIVIISILNITIQFNNWLDK